MSGIKQPIQDILNILATMQVVNADGSIVGMYSRVWNNQFKYEEQGKLYDYPKPAAFLEIINKATYEEIGIGFQMPGMGEMRAQLDSLDESEFDRVEAMVRSMTPFERTIPSRSTAHAGPVSPEALA